MMFGPKAAKDGESIELSFFPCCDEVLRVRVGDRLAVLLFGPGADEAAELREGLDRDDLGNVS